MTTGEKSPEELRAIFGQNLRTLSARSKSISQVCRDIGMNRTQFNRYLNGEAFPRPDVLQQICSYFDRDARILLQPLSEIDGPSAGNVPTEIDGMPFFKKIISFDHNRIPDGLYRLINPSFITEVGIQESIVRLFTLSNGGKGIEWQVPLDFAERTGQSTLWKDRKHEGYCFQHTDGFSASITSDYSSFIVNSFFSYGHHGDPDLHPGFGTITQARGLGKSQAHPAMLERIKGGCAGAVKARRNAVMKSIDDLPAVYREYMNNWTPR